MSVCLSGVTCTVHTRPETLFESISPDCSLPFVFAQLVRFFVLFRHSSPNELALRGKVRGKIQTHWKSITT